MTPATERVSVVIITYQRPDYLRRSLDHLSQQTEPADQIIVVDTSSDDSSARIVQLEGGIRYVRGPRPGDMTASRNAALTEVTGDIIAFLDDDAFVAPNYLAELRRAYADSSIGLACSRTLNNVPGEATEFGAGIGRVLENGELTANFGFAASDLIPIDHGIGATMSFRRETLAALGGFRPGYRGTCVREESDAFLRARALGYRAVFIPNAIAEHVAAPHVHGRRFDLRYDYWFYRNHAILLIANFGIGSPLLPRWVAHSCGTLIRDGDRSPQGRIARLLVRFAGLVLGVVVASARGRGAPLPAARDDAEGRRLRASLGSEKTDSLLAPSGAPPEPGTR